MNGFFICDIFRYEIFRKDNAKNGTKQVNELDGAMGNRFLDSGTTGFWFWYDVFPVLVRHVSGSGKPCFRILIRLALSINFL